MLQKLSFIILCGLLSTSLWACPQQKKSDPYCLESKFSEKAHMIFSYQNELNLSNEQVEKVRNIKVHTKKSLVDLKAEIEKSSIDIFSSLWKQPVATSEAYAAIDAKAAASAKKQKLLVDAIASLKGLLTEEQLQILTNLYLKQKKSSLCQTKDNCPLKTDATKCKQDSNCKNWQKNDCPKSKSKCQYQKSSPEKKQRKRYCR